MMHSLEYFTPLHSHPQSQHLPLQVVHIMNVSESPEIVQHAGTVLLGNILELVIISFFFGLLSLSSS